MLIKSLERNIGGYFMTADFAVIALWFYFIPTIIADYRGHDYRWIIFAINLCLGLTVIGWLVALIWAIYPKDKSLANPILGNPTGIGRRNEPAVRSVNPAQREGSYDRIDG
jgi:hypothetical protein